MYLLKKLWTKSGVLGLVITANNRKFMAHINQRFLNLKLLKLTGDRFYEEKLVTDIIEEQKTQQVKAGFLRSIASSCMEPIIFFTGAVILYTAVDLLKISNLKDIQKNKFENSEGVIIDNDYVVYIFNNIVLHF